jgi:hypothetical protein
MQDAAAPNRLRNIVRVLISSTFRVTRAERDYLVNLVFTELRERLERLGSTRLA